MKHIDLSIIIVSYNVSGLLLNCIDSLISTIMEIEYEIIVVDNASSDDSIAQIKNNYPSVKLIENQQNFGFAKANNQGYKISKGEFILLLNPDTIVKPGAIKTMLDFMKSRRDAGMAGCRLLNPDGSLQKSICPFPSVAEHLLKSVFLDRLIYSRYRDNTYFQKAPLKIDYASGAFLLVRREALGNMQLLNSNFFMYAEEKDLALRLIKNGWYTYFVPSAETIHYGGQSTDQMAAEMFHELQRSQVKFFFTYYKGINRFALTWSYWFLLCATFLGATLFSKTPYGKWRMKLFSREVLRYPGLVRHISKRFK